MNEIRKKRVRRDPVTTRKLILDATEKIMVEEGYAAVSSRRIAQEIGVNAATVHYYYPVTDDIFIALHRRVTDEQLVELDGLLAADSPLKALWQFQSGWSRTALGVEFLSLSNHRKAIQSVLAQSTNETRILQAARLKDALARSGFVLPDVPPVALTVVLVALARILANEERVGITEGHAEVRVLVERMLGEVAIPKA